MYCATAASIEFPILNKIHTGQLASIPAMSFALQLLVHFSKSRADLGVALLPAAVQDVAIKLLV